MVQQKREPRELKGEPMLQPKFTVASEAIETNHARLTIEPLEKGYGHTLGVSLRRVLLSSIEGAAVTKVRIDGVQHQFSTLEGMHEDVVELILNIKQLRFSLANEEEVVVKLQAKGPATVTGKDISLPAGVTLVNPEQELAILSGKKNLSVEITISRGLGYALASEQTVSTLGDIPVDASFSPIMRVAYKVEATRVGRRTDFDKLIIDTWTDGTIEAKEALDRAAKILVAHFKQIFDPILVETVEVEPELSPAENEVMRLTVEELDLPTRIANALRKGGYATVKDLCKADNDSIAKVKNLGEKSVDIVVAALQQKGLNLRGI
jgi:DNA-directed RNA polymerase subunit alpha